MANKKQNKGTHAQLLRCAAFAVEQGPWTSIFTSHEYPGLAVQLRPGGSFEVISEEIIEYRVATSHFQERDVMFYHLKENGRLRKRIESAPRRVSAPSTVLFDDVEDLLADDVEDLLADEQALPLSTQGTIAGMFKSVDDSLDDIL